MSTQAMTALWDRLQSDEQFRGQVEQAGTPAEKRQLLTAAGYEVEPGDLGALRSLAGISEISDEDLEKVAGGGGATTAVGTAWVGSVAAAAAAAAL